MICPFKVKEYVSEMKNRSVDCEETGCELWMSDFSGNSGCSLRMLPEVLSQWMVIQTMRERIHISNPVEEMMKNQF